MRLFNGLDFDYNTSPKICQVFLLIIFILICFKKSVDGIPLVVIFVFNERQAVNQQTQHGINIMGTIGTYRIIKDNKEFNFYLRLDNYINSMSGSVKNFLRMDFSTIESLEASLKKIVPSANFGYVSKIGSAGIGFVYDLNVDRETLIVSDEDGEIVFDGLYENFLTNEYNIFIKDKELLKLLYSDAMKLSHMQKALILKSFNEKTILEKNIVFAEIVKIKANYSEILEVISNVDAKLSAYMLSTIDCEVIEAHKVSETLYAELDKYMDSVKKLK